MEIIINGKKFKVSPGETILEVAERKGIKIPTLCHHPDVTIKESCRVCVVETKEGFLPACSTKVKEGMEIKTDTLDTKSLRKTNLELLFSQHQEECFDCIWNQNCRMLDLAREYEVEINRFQDRKDHYPVYRFGSSLEFDSTKCIDCRNCIEVCQKQGVGFLEVRGRGHLMEILPSKKKDKDCIYCGQCILHCPAGAFEAVGEFEKIEEPFQKKDKTVVFQIAPAVRASIGEEFGIPYNVSIMGKLVATLKKLGGDKVFDVPVGADFTTVEESKELLERIEKDDLPLFTSCCPAWVSFVEFYYPEFISRLTSVRSPHIILGGLTKTIFARQKGIRPEDVYVVSVMPCVAKKEEIEKEELQIEGVKPVDYVMTTREAGRLFKRHRLDFEKMKEEEIDHPFGEASSAGVAYGTSGGVMQSAIFNLTGQNPEFKEVKEGVREAKVRYREKELKLAVVHGLLNAKKMLEEVKENPHKYDYVEIMACHGGCIGGGGQPVPSCKKVIEERKKALCMASGKKEGFKPGENPGVKKVYAELLNSKEEVSKLCHTSYKKRAKSPINKNK